MDYKGELPEVNVPDPLDLDTVKATSLCTDTFCLPLDAGLEGQVLTSDGAGNTSWDNGTGNKGDLLYVNDTTRTVIANAVGTGSTSNLVPLTPGIGSLTIPANTISKGDVYILELVGDYSVPSTPPDKYLLVEFTINGTVVAAAGNAPLIRAIQPSTPTTSEKAWRSVVYLTFKGLPTEGINAVVEGFHQWADFEADDTRTRRFEGGENITVDAPENPPMPHPPHRVRQLLVRAVLVASRRQLRLRHRHRQNRRSRRHVRQSLSRLPESQLLESWPLVSRPPRCSRQSRRCRKTRSSRSRPPPTRRLSVRAGPMTAMSPAWCRAPGDWPRRKMRRKRYGIPPGRHSGPWSTCRVSVTRARITKRRRRAICHSSAC